LIQRLARFGLEVAGDKTQVIEFSHCKALAKTKFDFLGFEFRWIVGRSRKPLFDAPDIQEQTQSITSEFQSMVSETQWFSEENTLCNTE
jgi:hypothetical protein